MTEERAEDGKTELVVKKRKVLKMKPAGSDSGPSVSIGEESTDTQKRSIDPSENLKKIAQAQKEKLAKDLDRGQDFEKVDTNGELDDLGKQEQEMDRKKKDIIKIFEEGF